MRSFVTVSDIIDFEILLIAWHCMLLKNARNARPEGELVLMKLTILHHLSTRFSLANGMKKLQCNMIFSAIVAES